jgi:hypothetical protein
MSEILEFGIDFFDQLLALDRGAQQGLQRGKKHLRILQGKSTGRHRIVSILIHRRSGG